jgi:ABC-2 type transport system permease protein
LAKGAQGLPIFWEMIQKFKKYLKIWWMMSANSFSVVLGQKLALLVFFIGKVFRFAVFFLFLFFLLKGTGSLANYSVNQIIFFFLTFNLVDVITQFLFREVYSFRGMIVKGDFDLVLVKPINALFRVLMGGADVIDLITTPPLIILTIVYGISLHPSLSSTLIYLVLLVNGFLIATAFHIAILAFAIITLEIDHAVMIYRDVTNLGKIPVDIYKQPLRAFLTYFIPVGIMMSLPAKAIMGLATSFGIALAVVIGILAIFLALRFWNFALTKYTSASS